MNEKEQEHLRTLKHLKAVMKKQYPCLACEQSKETDPYCALCTTCIEYEKSLEWAIDKLEKENGT